MDSGAVWSLPSHLAALLISDLATLPPRVTGADSPGLHSAGEKVSTDWLCLAPVLEGEEGEDLWDTAGLGDQQLGRDRVGLAPEWSAQDQR